MTHQQADATHSITNDDTTVTLTAYSDLADVRRIQVDWDAFIEHVESDVFFSFDWCEVWWRHYGGGRRPRILVFRKSKAIIGILPLYVDRVKIGPLFVRILKFFGVDYSLNTFRLPIAEAYFHEVISAFLNYAQSNDRWDIVLLGPISGFYQHTGALLDELGRNTPRNFKIRAVKCGRQSFIDSCVRWEDYLQGLGPSTRRNIRRSYNVMQKQGMEIACSLATPENAVGQFGRFVAMHQRRWQAEGRLGYFRSWPRSLAFHTDLVTVQAERNRLRLLEVSIGGESVGFDYSYRLGAGQWDLLNARVLDPVMKGVDLGKVIWCEVLKRAIHDEIHIVDYMRGPYDYKSKLGVRSLAITSVYITPASMSRAGKARAFFLLSHLVHILYYRLWRNRLSPILRIKQRPLAKLWIHTHWFGEAQA
jgi:CelD/BcsL family acetyltransferase involved in cellulose biosynthesis